MVALELYCVDTDDGFLGEISMEGQFITCKILPSRVKDAQTKPSKRKTQKRILSPVEKEIENKVTILEKDDLCEMEWSHPNLSLWDDNVEDANGFRFADWPFLVVAKPTAVKPWSMKPIVFGVAQLNSKVSSFPPTQPFFKMSIQ